MYKWWVIDQAWGQDGWILAKFFFFLFMDRNEVEVHKLEKKKNKANIQQSWPKCLLNKGQDSSILPAQVANHNAWFGSSFPLTKLAIIVITLITCLQRNALIL